jgi:hypothetical protein
MRNWLIAFLIWTIPAAAVAGPWPRQPGAIFVSVSYQAATDAVALWNLQLMPPDTYTGIYAEIGLTPRLTFGLDGGFSEDGAYSAIVLARYALGDPDARMRYAVSLGAGRSGPPHQAQVQIGAHVGRGLKLAGRSGWASLDVAGIHRLDSSDIAAKADLTLGLNLSETWTTILQLQAGQYAGSAAYLRIAPSLVRTIGPRLKVEVGLMGEVLGSRQVGAKLATWISF